MAIRQSLKGNQNNPRLSKTYDVLINFNRGIDKVAADDLASDSSFRELSNFYNEKEGVLSKRPGLYDSKLNAVINDLATWNESHTFCGYKKSYGNIKNCAVHFSLFNSTVMQGNPLKSSGTENYLEYTFHPKTLIGFNVVKDNNFHTLLENYKIDGENKLGENGLPNTFEFDALFVMSGTLDLFDTSWNIPDGGWDYQGRSAILVAKVNIKRTLNESNDYTDTIMNIALVGSWQNNEVEKFKEINFVRWDYNKDLDEPIEYASYNGYTYITTGSNYLIKVMDEYPDHIEYNEHFPDNDWRYNVESFIIQQVGGAYSENVYKPTPVEASNIGFNIMANDPLNYVNNIGQTDAVKGVFYSVIKDGYREPIADIPANDTFTIHIMTTGSGALGTPQYRQNNGETDTTKNPYKNLPGSFEGNLFVCSGIDMSGDIEFKFTKGNATFISYASTGTSYNNEVGQVHETKKLIFSSTHIKVVNNQLLLYGNHGYIFFSEYDNFGYYPNYFYLFVTTEAGEKEVTGISYFRQYYAVYTNKKIKRMTGSFGADNFGLYPLNDFVGCPNGKTIKQVNNNLLFVGVDGLYKLKQGYLGEGTENVEKIDDALGNEINSNNVLQCFVLGNYYIMVRSDKNELTIYDFEKDTFFNFDLESAQVPVCFNPNIDKKLIYYADRDKMPLTFDDFFKKYRTFRGCFQNLLYDEHGSSLYIPEYSFEVHGIKTNISNPYQIATYQSGIKIRQLRISDLDFLSENERHKDALGFISKFETPKLSMGYPTNTKKFKEIYIKTINDSGKPIPLFVSIYIDDVAYVTPENYEVQYDQETNTFYYVYKSNSNAEIIEGAEIIKGQPVIGELVLGKDKIGNNTTAQLKIRINKKGRSIKLVVSDGYNDTNNLKMYSDRNDCLVTYDRIRNINNFTIAAVGIVYKLKKVKEG